MSCKSYCGANCDIVVQQCKIRCSISSPEKPMTIMKEKNMEQWPFASDDCQHNTLITCTTRRVDRQPITSLESIGRCMRNTSWSFSVTFSICTLDYKSVSLPTRFWTRPHAPTVSCSRLHDDTFLSSRGSTSTLFIWCGTETGRKWKQEVCTQIWQEQVNFQLERVYIDLRHKTRHRFWADVWICRKQMSSLVTFTLQPLKSMDSCLVPVALELQSTSWT